MLATLVALVLSAAAQDRVAVMDVKPRGGVAVDMSQIVTDALVAEVRKRVAPTVVVGGEDIRNMLGFAGQKQKFGCLDVQCLTEIGGALGADRVVVGTLAKLGSSYVLDLRLIDDRKAQVITEGTERLKGKDEDELLDAVGRIVAQLFPSRPAPRALALQPSTAPVFAQGAGVPAVAVEAPAGPSASHPRPLAIGLGAAAVLGLALGVVGLVEVLSVERYTSGPAGRLVTNPQGTVNSANLWGTLGVAGAIVAVGTGTGAALAW